MLDRTDIRRVQEIRSTTLRWILRVATCLLIYNVIVRVLVNYPDYFPANFESEFLRGRDRYFWAGYHWAFYVHIISGPFALVLGTILISDRFRMQFPQWHRYLGRVQGINVLFLVAPSGLWMSYHAVTGFVAALGFGSLSIATAACMALGWKTAVQRRFAAHRKWMLRCFLTLCSAVVLRLTAGVSIVTQIESEWVYPMSAWTSWLVPLIIFELVSSKNRIKQVLVRQ